MSAETLLPCPFCGDEATRDRSLRNGRKDGEPNAWVYYVRCPSCQATGGYGNTAASADYLWNNRATPPAGPVTTATAGCDTLREQLLRVAEDMETECFRTANMPQCRMPGCTTLRTSGGNYCKDCQRNVVLQAAEALRADPLFAGSVLWIARDGLKNRGCHSMFTRQPTWDEGEQVWRAVPDGVWCGPLLIEDLATSLGLAPGECKRFRLVPEGETP